MTQKYDLNIYVLQHADAEGFWADSNLDVFGNQDSDAQFICPYYGWTCQNKALIALIDIERKFKDHEFRIAEFHVVRELVSIIV